jgi:hypothetical protein
MRDFSVPDHVPSSQWLTTGGVARLLERSPWHVRWLARTGRLACERTACGQYLFRKSDVRRLMTHRAEARLRGVYIGRPKMLRVSGEPRQLWLLRPCPVGPARVDRPRLRLVGGRAQDADSSTEALIQSA